MGGRKNFPGKYFFPFIITHSSECLAGPGNTALDHVIIYLVGFVAVGDHLTACALEVGGLRAAAAITDNLLLLTLSTLTSHL
jgi:hypothetical protein